MNPIITQDHDAFVRWLRSTSPYVRAHRGRTFVIGLDGELLAADRFEPVAQDLALIASLGVRLVLVGGAGRQIKTRLAEAGLALHQHRGRPVVTEEALPLVKQAVGGVRIDLEAALATGADMPPVISGNLVTARPIGVRAGIDHGHAGEARRINTQALRRHLDDGAVVLLPPLGCSSTGETFLLPAEEVAAEAAIALKANKLIFLIDGPGLVDARGRRRELLTPQQVERMLRGRGKPTAEVAAHLSQAVRACRAGVRRAHLVPGERDGGLLLELFTRDGVGALVTDETYEGIRRADIEDVAGILRLIGPLEREGALVRRSREMLETEIGRFTVIERDGMIIGCAALYPFNRDKAGELACVAVHCDYQQGGRGTALLDQVERAARKAGLKKLFTLTTHASQWFREHGFAQARLADLPVRRQGLYNYQRNSRVYLKHL